MTSASRGWEELRARLHRDRMEAQLNGYEWDIVAIVQEWAEEGRDA